MIAELEAEPLPPFVSAVSIVRDQLEILRPPRRMSVSRAAETFRVLKNPGGGYSGPWQNGQVPYMTEPADMLSSRRHEAVIFCGPAQTGKTAALIENPILHSVACDPADVLVVQMSETMARDFSKRRLDRMIRESDIMSRRLDPAGDNVFDKEFAGMMLSIGHPTPTQLSSRPIPRILFTDYDRMPEDIGGEGAPFDLGLKRTQTFGSRGMTLAESSPGRTILDAKWKPSTAHEAPPATGILALYNRGDRRRWQWPCPHCGEYFEGSFANLSWPDGVSPEEAALAVVMVCPENGCVIEPKHRNAMNAAGIWVPDGMRVEDGKLVGPAPTSSIASYWMKGTAAAFINWSGLVAKYLRALADYEQTGAEESLKATINTDQGEAYLPKAAQIDTPFDAEELIEAAESYPLRRVPEQAVYLTAAVDVQANRFEVLVRGWGQALESWIVDRFTLFQSGTGDAARPLDPARYAEDWDLLLETLVNKSYAHALGGRLSIVRIAIDSGGAAGVTANAYEFYWRHRRTSEGRRVMLLKGASTKNAPRVAQTFPDSKRKDRKAARRGEVPVWLFNPNLLKDELDAGLRRSEGGPRAVHLTRALMDKEPPHRFFEELTAENRRPDGTWQKHRARNEALDLMVMSHVAALALRADRINWNKPPTWAELAGSNPYWMAEPMADYFEEVPAAEMLAEETAQEQRSSKRKHGRRGRPGRSGSYVGGWR